ncbi:MAG: hypothetical protein RR227_01740 [Oscillospiraceae bacterium]
MWLSQKAASQDFGTYGDSVVGYVTVGGARPCVLTEGEVRNAELVSCGGAVLLPKTGDEVLLTRSVEGESFVVGTVVGGLPADILEDEVFITAGKGSTIRIKQNGEIELSGNIVLNGKTDVVGQLFINGAAYAPPIPSGGGGVGA